MIRLKLILLVIFISLSTYLKGQSVLPFFENYTKQDYKGENQIWSITQGEDYAMYFANNRFFLRFNGVVWEKYTLPNQTIIRSVFSFKDKIYSGSFNEFGYWTRDKNSMVYHSLVPKDFFKETDSEEVWKIFFWKGKVYFQTFSEMYVYDFQTIKRVKFPTNISYCFVNDNNFYVATVESGIYEWNEKTFQKIEKWKIFDEKIVHNIQKNDNKIYFFTQKSGVFIDDDNRISAWQHPINERLKTELIITSHFLSSNKLMIGTSNNGFYLVDLKENTFLNINKNVSLPNNTVLSFATDKENDIWLGLDNGITHVETNSPYGVFTDRSGELGSVYAIQSTNSGLLLGSNHGLFKYEQNTLKFVDNSQGQIWDIYKSDNQYVVGHNDGTFLYKDGIYTKQNSINGGWNFKPNLFEKGYIQCNYTGIAFFPSIENLQLGSKLTGFYAPIKEFLQLSKNEILAAHNNKSLFYIKFDDNKKTTNFINITQKNALNDDYDVRIFQYKGETLFYINKQWYLFDNIDFKLKPHQLFNSKFSGISEIIEIDNENFAIVKDDILFIINQQEDDFLWRSIPIKLYAGRLIYKNIKIIKNGEKFILNLDDGFLIFDSIHSKIKHQNITIEGFINGAIIKNKKIPNKKTIELHVISNYFGNNKSNLYYAINDAEPLPLIENKIILNTLSSGNYSVTIFENKGDGLKEIKKYEFKVKLPWYASFWMILIYIVLFSIILLIYYKWNKIRFIEKLKLKEEEIKHKIEMKQMEIESKNRLKIQEYEKHILENQVQMKANELAGKSLSLAKQTELIDSIQEILENEHIVQNLKSKIYKAIKIYKLNKNEWKSFENNLLKSNEEFVKNLTIRYSNLTSKDIKLCIYLKMNLSSKEIAPLMNISYRGVELHRYRMRKKLGINQEDNLNSFMNNL